MLIKVKNGTLYADLVGPAQAPVVCMLHSLASDSGMWSQQVGPILAADRRCLRIDFPGHGGSPLSEAPVTIDALVDSVVEVIRALQIDRVDIVGLSMGGIVAQGIAIKHPELVGALLLSDCIPAAVEAAKPAWQMRTDAARKAGTMAPLAEPMLSKWVKGSFRDEQPTLWEGLYRTLANTPVDGFCSLVDVIQNFDHTASLPSLNVRTRVLVGALDEASPPAAVQRVAALIPNAAFFEIPGGQHLPNVDHPELFNQHLSQWLANA